MKAILKVLTFPIVLILDLFTWICVGLISCSTILFKLASAILALLAVAVLVTYSVTNGLILLTFAFLVSPLGIPMIAVWLLNKLQSANQSIKTHILR